MDLLHFDADSLTIRMNLDLVDALIGVLEEVDSDHPDLVALWSFLDAVKWLALYDGNMPTKVRQDVLDEAMERHWQFCDDGSGGVWLSIAADRIYLEREKTERLKRFVENPITHEVVRLANSSEGEAGD